MKEETREKKTTETIYIAIDGTEFKDKSECKKYEESAQCALLAKYNPYVTTHLTEYQLFDTGSEDYEYDIFKLQHDWQIDTLIQLKHLSYSRCTQEELDGLRQKLQKNMGNNILIGRGCGYDGFSFYIYGSIEDRITYIRKACKIDEEA